MLKRRWKSIYYLNGGVPAPLSRAWTGWAQRQKITKGGKQAKCNLLPNITVNLRSAIAIVQLSVKARLKNNWVYMSTPRKIFRLLVIEANIIVIFQICTILPVSNSALLDIRHKTELVAKFQYHQHFSYLPHLVKSISEKEGLAIFSFITRSTIMTRTSLTSPCYSDSCYLANLW